MSWRPPEASYLAWLDCAGLGLPNPAEEFLRQGVAVEAGSHFGEIGAGHARLNFGTSAEILDEAIGRMAKALGKD